MRFTEFVQPYPCNLTDAQIHRGEHAAYIGPALDYSYRWGKVLHAALRGTDTDAFTSGADFARYGEWAYNDLPEMEERLRKAPPDVWARGITETHFHHLNMRMLHLWPAIGGAAWTNDHARAEDLRRAQDYLALDSMAEYAAREDVIQAGGGTHVLFEKENEAATRVLTGILTQNDAAILLMEAFRGQRWKNITILPAPLQFEREYQPANIDFLVADCTNKTAVGVQAKSRLHWDDYAGVDPARVLFLHGDLDMDNIRIVETRRGGGRKRVAWPGVLAVKRVEQMKSYGPIGRHLWPGGTQVPKLKRLATRLTGGIKVDYRELADRIRTRILEKM